MDASLLVHLLEVVPQHRGEHALAPVVGMHPHPGETGARHLSGTRVRSGDRQRQREDAVDPGGVPGSEPSTPREPLLLGKADQLLRRGRRRDLVEPDGVVSGKVALWVGRAADADLALGHGPTQPPAGGRLNRFTVVECPGLTCVHADA